LVLVNGADGICTGWSTQVPNYNPREIIRNIRKMLRGEQMQDLTPWYKGFTGSIVANEKEAGKYEITGVIEKRSDTLLVITELPVKNWTQSYKEFLEELMPQEGGKKGEESSDSTITEYREYHTESTVHFELTLTPEQMKKAEAQGLEKTFKLKSSLATSNMVLFDHEGKISKYNTALDILKDFCTLRRKIYEDRKAYLVAKLTREKEILSNKARFILMVVKGELEIRKKKKAELLVELQKKGFKKMSELDAILEGRSADDKDEKAAPVGEGEDAEKTDYDYLLGMSLWSLTFEKVEEIKKLKDVKMQELEELKKTTIEMMWDRDLEALLKALGEVEAIEAEDADAAAAASEGRRKKDAAKGAAAAARKRPAPRPKKAAVDDDEDRAMDKALMKRPLQETVAGEAVEKQTWGSGAALVRSKPEPAAPARGEEPPPMPPATKARRKAPASGGRGGGGGGAEGEGGAAPSEAPAPPPPKEEGGALLSRLLSKTGGMSSSSSSHAPLGGSSLSSFQSLGGGEDVFAYLKLDSDNSKPYNSLDFGGPPGLSSSGAADDSVSASVGTGGDDADEGGAASGSGASRGRGRGKAKGRGRGKASAADDDDAAEDDAPSSQPAKKRRG